MGETEGTKNNYTQYKGKPYDYFMECISQSDAIF